jgi:protein involved in polysaccharide export with SLBB domain
VRWVARGIQDRHEVVKDSPGGAGVSSQPMPNSSRGHPDVRLQRVVPPLSPEYFPAMTPRTDVSTGRFRIFCGVSMFVLAWFIGGPTGLWAQEGQAEAQAVPRAHSTDSVDPADVIFPGDVIKLDVWREKDLSGEFTVDRNGIVVLPLVGRFDVSAETPETFEARVVAALLAEIENPSIDVTVLRRVRVTGFVRAGGVFALDPTMSVADALAMAGGLDQDGLSDRVLLFRGGTVVMSDLDLSASVYESSIRSGDELRVPQRGWFSRNSGSLITGASAFVGIIVTLIATSGN